MAVRKISLALLLFFAPASNAEHWRCLHPKVDWISGDGKTKTEAWDHFYHNYHRRFTKAYEENDWKIIEWFKSDKDTKGNPRCSQIR